VLELVEQYQGRQLGGVHVGSEKVVLCLEKVERGGLSGRRILAGFVAEVEPVVTVVYLYSVPSCPLRWRRTPNDLQPSVHGLNLRHAQIYDDEIDTSKRRLGRRSGGKAEILVAGDPAEVLSGTIGSGWPRA
jgi:hypothetical protein